MTPRLHPGGILYLPPRGLGFQWPQAVAVLEKQQRGEYQKGLPMAGSVPGGQGAGGGVGASGRI